MRRLAQVALLLLCTACNGEVPSSPVDPNAPMEHWAIYYDYHVPASRFAACQVVVFDRVYYPDFRSLRKSTKVLARIPAGEIIENSRDKVLLEHESALFSAQPKEGRWAVDLRSPAAQSLVMGYVEDALRKGFDGVMLDGMDSSFAAAEEVSSQVADSNREATIALIHKIHKKRPGMKIMLNRAFSILPQVSKEIDYILAENILTEFNVFTGQSRLIPSNTYQQTAGSLRWARNLSPTIKIYTLDYWDPNDVEGVKKIYRLQREQGFSPYVTSPDLRHFTPEP